MWDRSGDMHSGVFAAEMLNMFCREEESLGLALASYFQPVTVVNRNTTNERTLELSLRNFAGLTKASARLLVPLTLEVKGKFVQQDEQLPVMARTNVELKLPPCGIAQIRLKKQ